MNGSLLTVGRGYKVLHPPDTFCIDGTINHNVGVEFPIPGPDYEPVHYSGSELDQVAIICYPEQDSFGSTTVTAELSVDDLFQVARLIASFAYANLMRCIF